MFPCLLRLAPASLVFSSTLLVAPAMAAAQVRDVTVLATPGATSNAVRTGILRLFTAVTGIPVADADMDGSLEQLRAHKDADLALIRGDVLLAACDEGLLEKVDWSAVGGRDHYPAFATTDCGVGATLSATVLAWDRDKFQGTPTWGDFWDIAKYPGKRSLRRGARGNLEAALMADGVSAGDIYRTLRSADGVDRAFRKLDQLRPYLVWWDTEAQAVELIGSGEALMGSVPASEALAGNRDGGRRFGLQWGGALIAMESWAVLKGAAQVRLAQQIIYFAGTPAIEARMLTASGVPGVAKGATDGVATDVVAASPASGAVVSGGLPVDEAFWRESGDKLGQRFSTWLAH